MAEQKRILVLESEKLMAAGIFAMLVAQPHFDVTRTTAVSLASLDHTDNLQIDVIILEEEHLTANILDMVKFLNCSPNLRLIVFRLSDTKIQIFDKQIIEVRNAADFFELL